ncbi:MAG: hypothetical protein O8C64_10255 [Candidatus Methanoperedens sp.]|nr:hypothetical protein [Candidatus Methanoperedens sp.]MCZ7403918.1 hypothetical protein [Candidatus Methanoperedens sp.]
MTGLILNFCPGKQVFQGKEHYDDKSNDFGNEIIRETGYVGMPEHCKEIIKPVIGSSPGKTPSIQRPEENLRLCPHFVFEEVQERSAGNQKDACISAAPVMIKSQKSEDKGECKGMGNKATAGKRIGKEYPAKELIDDIRQQGSKYHIQVVDPAPDSGYKILEDEKQSKCNAEVTEKEHDVFKGLYESKYVF